MGNRHAAHAAGAATGRAAARALQTRCRQNPALNR